MNYYFEVSFSLEVIVGLMAKINQNTMIELTHWPITEDLDNPVNQSKLEANTCGRQKAREMSVNQATDGFGWLIKWREVFQTNYYS